MGEGFDPFSTYKLIPMIKNRLDMSDSEAREIAITLSQPKTKSFFDEEKLKLLKMAEMDDFKDELEKHTKEYYWLANNYACTRKK